jgi:hypothetical protein
LDASKPEIVRRMDRDAAARGRRRIARHAVRAALCLTIGSTVSCAANPGPGQSGYPYNLDGTYTGRVFFEGEPFDATFEVQTRGGGAVQGSFRVRQPMLIDGRLEGVLVDDLLRLRVDYGSPGGCDGWMEGVVTVSRGGATFEGPVTVRDCGEPIAGRLAFERSSGDPPDASGPARESAPCP